MLVSPYSCLGDHPVGYTLDVPADSDLPRLSCSGMINKVPQAIFGCRSAKVKRSWTTLFLSGNIHLRFMDGQIYVKFSAHSNSWLR